MATRRTTRSETAKAEKSGDLEVEILFLNEVISSTLEATGASYVAHHQNGSKIKEAMRTAAEGLLEIQEDQGQIKSVTRFQAEKEKSEARKMEADEKYVKGKIGNVVMDEFVRDNEYEEAGNARKRRNIDNEDEILAGNLPMEDMFEENGNKATYITYRDEDGLIYRKKCDATCKNWIRSSSSSGEMEKSMKRCSIPAIEKNEHLKENDLGNISDDVFDDSATTTEIKTSRFPVLQKCDGCGKAFCDRQVCLPSYTEEEESTKGCDCSKDSGITPRGLSSVNSSRFGDVSGNTSSSVIANTSDSSSQVSLNTSELSALGYVKVKREVEPPIVISQPGRRSVDLMTCEEKEKRVTELNELLDYLEALRVEFEEHVARDSIKLAGELIGISEDTRTLREAIEDHQRSVDQQVKFLAEVLTYRSIFYSQESG